MDDDVYLRYRPISGEWELRHPDISTKFDKVGGNLYVFDYLVDTMAMHCVNINNNVNNEINKFRNMRNPYYVRKFIKSLTFIINSAQMKNVSANVKRTMYSVYNYDPWNRQFPNFLCNTSNYYDNCDNKSRYRYWVFYNNHVVDNSAFGGSNVSSLYNNVVPQMILTTTSLEGVTVACLDLIEA